MKIEALKIQYERTTAIIEQRRRELIAAIKISEQKQYRSNLMELSLKKEESKLSVIKMQ